MRFHKKHGVCHASYYLQNTGVIVTYKFVNFIFVYRVYNSTIPFMILNMSKL